MTQTLFFVNDAPYGDGRPYNALLRAGTLAGNDGRSVRLFLMADAVGCAKRRQKAHEGYHNVELMLGRLLRTGEVSLCSTCMHPRGLRDDDLIEGARRGSPVQLADWTADADKVLVF